MAYAALWDQSHEKSTPGLNDGRGKTSSSCTALYSLMSGTPLSSSLSSKTSSYSSGGTPSSSSLSSKTSTYSPGSVPSSSITSGTPSSSSLSSKTSSYSSGTPSSSSLSSKTSSYSSGTPSSSSLSSKTSTYSPGSVPSSSITSSTPASSSLSSKSSTYSSGTPSSSSLGSKTSTYSPGSVPSSSITSGTPSSSSLSSKTSSYSPGSVPSSSITSSTPASSSLSSKTSSYSSGTPSSSSLSSKTSSYSASGTASSSITSGTPATSSLSSKTSTYSPGSVPSSSITSSTPASSSLSSKTSTYSPGSVPSSSITSSTPASSSLSSKTSSYSSGTPATSSLSSKTSTYSPGSVPSSSITSSTPASSSLSSKTSTYSPGSVPSSSITSSTPASSSLSSKTSSSSSGTPSSSSLSSKTSTYSSGGTPSSSITSSVSSSTFPSSKTSFSTGGLSSAYSPRPYVSKSQTSQATPKPAPQVSTVKPAQFETSSSASAMATKPGEVTTTTTGGGVTVGGSAAVGAGKAETNTALMAGAAVIDMSATEVMRGGPRQTFQTAPMSQVKAPATVPSALTGTAGTAGRATTTTSTAASTPTAPSTASTAGSTARGGAVTSALTQTKDAAKVQVEVPSAVKVDKKSPAVDPLDALASILPSADSVVRPQPEYTGPEVTEIGVTAEEAERCGEREDTLPPGYRLGDMPPPPADWKPQDVPKPLSTDEALDSLSLGFMTPPAPTGPAQQKKLTAGSGDALDPLAGDFATAIATPVICTPPPPPPPAQKQDLLDNVVSASAGLTNYGKPPADKKAKMEKGSGYMKGITAIPFKKSSPPTEKKVKGDSVSSDALSALGDLLPVNVPKPEPPKLRPEDIVSEAKHKEEEAVFVGERDDSIHQKYRPNKEALEKLPALKPEPTIGTGAALDILSEDFVTAMATPAICTPPPPPPPPPPAQKVQAPLPDDFSLEPGLTATTAKKVESAAAPPPPPPPDERRTKGSSSTKGGAMSQGALSALGDLLPSDAPKPELPELRPEDLVSEKKHTEEEAVFVGERDDSINPKYRFNKEKLEEFPAPKPQPTMATGDALDILSGDFVTSAAAPAVQSSMVQACAPPAQQGKVEDLSALDFLSGDFVAPTKASQSHAAGPPATKKGAEQQKVPQDTKPESKDASISLDALSSLSDMLPANVPRPESPKLRPEDIVSENKHKKEEAVLVGEKEDSIHPDYRFNKKELEKFPAPKPEPTMAIGDALDILSGDLMTSSTAPAVQAPLLCSTAPPTKSSADFALAGEFVTPSAVVTVESASGLVPDPEFELEAGADGALDALSNTLEDIKPTPMPEPVLPKNLVDEKKAVEERLIKMGERDDSLPPEYRPTEEDLKKMAEAKAAEKPKPSLDDKTALDLLSMDFTNTPEPPAACADTTKLEAPVLESDPLKVAEPMPGPVLKNLSETLLPDVPEFKVKTDKPKGKSKSKSKSKKHAEEPKDERPSQPSSDVVPASTKKGSRR